MIMVKKRIKAIKINMLMNKIIQCFQTIQLVMRGDSHPLMHFISLIQNG